MVTNLPSRSIVLASILSSSFQFSYHQVLLRWRSHPSTAALVTEETSWRKNKKNRFGKQKTKKRLLFLWKLCDFCWKNIWQSLARLLYLISFFFAGGGGEIPIVSCKLFRVHPKKTPCGRGQWVSGIGSQKNPTGHDLRKHATSLEPFLDSKHLRFPALGSAENNHSIGRFEFVIQSILIGEFLG